MEPLMIRDFILLLKINAKELLKNLKILIGIELDILKIRKMLISNRCLILSLNLKLIKSLK